MENKNKKFKIIISILIVIIICLFLTLFNLKNQKKVIEPNKESITNNQNGISDVVNTILDVDYQSITSLVNKDDSKGYIIVEAKNGCLKNNINKVLHTAKDLNIKLTFIENDDILDKNKPYLKMIEENGHTVLPKYLNLKSIFKKNNLKIIEREEDINKLDKQDAVFYIIIDEKYKNLTENLKNKLPKGVVNLKEQGYKFKAFI
ncbi:hypothetical protein J2Z53_002098 [Clostridium moniliforme]|uniref:Uncharacterized protein n=1 Tax=Clostridium moniliforme TaxID=39489 RepID=A0ABS4F2M0_9CLOT|nr:hypothetical protein [Clostridium moniliforme]MBP1890498.1 hypothetical protein [Clostridium moniliforme]